ncbi:MAG: hypothetical protein IJZ22_06750 [Bacteroidaceae bacterium]|nr:hypothetical protein [Bacteroidaceae bacterium]
MSKLIKRVMLISICVCSIAGVMYIAAIIFWYIYYQPSKNKFDRRIEWEYFWNKDKNGECIIDLAETMHFEWDSLIHYKSAFTPAKEGKCPSEYTNIMFMRNGNVVYYVDWFPYPYEEHPGGVVFMHEGDMLTVYPHDAKFKAYRKEGYASDYDSKFIFLEKVEK